MGIVFSFKSRIKSLIAETISFVFPSSKGASRPKMLSPKTKQGVGCEEKKEIVEKRKDKDDSNVYTGITELIQSGKIGYNGLFLFKSFCFTDCISFFIDNENTSLSSIFLG